MEDRILRQLILESDRLNEDESSEWSSVETLWQPYVAEHDLEAQFRLAYYCLFCSFDEGPQKRSEMTDLLRKVAERGHADAVYWLSRLYPAGSERDALLLRAGELGSLEAQRDLGAFYATGDWTHPRDLMRAAEWYRLAAERGHSDAQYNLGFMYLLGEGVPADVEKGLWWLRQAASLGDFSAFRLLADIYRHGYYGVLANNAEADHWDERYQQCLKSK
jgi:uncharacterized protein